MTATVKIWKHGSPRLGSPDVTIVDVVNTSTDGEWYIVACPAEIHKFKAFDIFAISESVGIQSAPGDLEYRFHERAARHSQCQCGRQKQLLHD